MPAAATRPATPIVPDEFGTLAGRFDPGVIDVPAGRARIRLELTGGASWDALVDGSGVRLSEAAEDVEPDAVLQADAATWRRVATDLREGMRAFGARRLRIRRNLHLGVGFLAATSGSTGPGRLRFLRLRTDTVGSISAVCAGEGDTVLCLHTGWAARRPPSFPPWPPWRTHTVSSRSTFRASANRTSRSAPPTTRVVCPGGRRGPRCPRVERAHLVGNSMGGRVAIEAGLTEGTACTGWRS